MIKTITVSAIACAIASICLAIATFNLTGKNDSEFTVKLDKPTHLVVEAPEYQWLTSDDKPCQSFSGDCSYKNAGWYSYSWAEPGGDTCVDESTICVCRVKFNQDK